MLRLRKGLKAVRGESLRTSAQAMRRVKYRVQTGPVFGRLSERVDVMADHRPVGIGVDYDADLVEAKRDALGIVPAAERRRHSFEACALLAPDRPCGGMDHTVRDHLGETSSSPSRAMMSAMPDGQRHLRAMIRTLGGRRTSPPSPRLRVGR